VNRVTNFRRHPVSKKRVSSYWLAYYYFFYLGVFVERFREQEEWKRSLSYERVIYVGDGGADFCASLSLQQADVVFARSNYSLHKRIIKDNGKKMKADFKEWSSGFDVRDFFTSEFS